MCVLTAPRLTRPFWQGPHAAEVLGCCHSVCRECWAHMELLAHGPVPCPLCRRQDFMLQLSASA